MEFWKFVQKKLEQEKRIMLMAVIESNGSSPGRRGFKMAVTEDKELAGSVGGGIMEYDIVELGFAMLQLGKSGPVMKKQIHKTGTYENHSGMICSGDQTIVLMALDKSHKDSVDKIIESLYSAKSGILKLSPKGMEFFPTGLQEKQLITEIHNEANWEYRELTSFRNHLFIIGAGHVGLAVSKLMKDLGFVVELFDDRKELSTFENNPYADKKHLIDYSEIDKFVPQGESIYVVIMTFGHQSDQEVLIKLIDKNFKYLGLMGSRSKIATLFEKTGIASSKEKITRVHAPIGIPINSKTPMEIAVSIAAEIIKIKNTED